MSALRFASEESLRFSITSGLVPANVLGAGARTWRAPNGAIVVAPLVPLSDESMKVLVAAGTERATASVEQGDERTVACWAEIVGVVRARGLAAELGQVLFFAPADASLIDLAGELLRLGCDRLEWRKVPGGHLLRAAAPPFYSLLGASDARDGVRAYLPSPSGQERVWVELGWEHPLARFLAPSPGSVLLVSAPGTFSTLPSGDFADIYSIVDLHVPGGGAARPLVAEEAAPRFAVSLRLARAAATAGPTLWVVRDRAVPKIERLLASLPEEAGHGLLFATLRDGEATVVVVRARPGARADVEIDGDAHRAHPSISNLFTPWDATLEPPLRRDRVRELLAPDPDQVVWLRRADDDGGFCVERAPEAAFRPLSDWVEYVVDVGAPALVPWVKSCTFDFESFVGVDPPPEQRSDGPETPPAAPPRRTKRAAPAPPPRPVRSATTRSAASLPGAPERATIVAARIDVDETTRELVDVERTFLALDAAADDPVRTELWARMAVLNARLERREDAALCWTRAIWELPSDPDQPAREAWVAAERAATRAASAKTLLALEDPSRDHVRALAATLIADAEPGLRGLASDASIWLDRHDAYVDVRTTWLARIAISRLVGGDRLGLARTRDRLLARIHGGLSLERDVPSFMRRAGASRDAAQVDLVAGKIESLIPLFEGTRRRRSATEADPKLTGAYVRFVVAYGLARLGRAEQAAHLRDVASAALPKGDPIHELLSRAYVARVGQALEGLPSATPLPPDVSGSLNALAKLERYKVDRVRQCSKVLEPQERLDPILAFQRGEADPRGPEFAELRGTSEPLAVEQRVAAILAKAKASPPDERARLFDGAMDFLPSIVHERAVAQLDAIVGEVAEIAPRRRVQLLEKGLTLAGHLGEEVLARKITTALEPLVVDVGPDGVTEIAPLVSGMVRTLRRFGQREEAARLLAALQVAAKGRATPHLTARLHVAAALAYLGEAERARPFFEEALTALKGELPMPERLQLTRVLARALGASPLAFALAGLEQLERRFEVVTDSFNTNSHVCISVVDFMEALVLGYVSDDLSVDPTARRLLDEDEHLVRRRIQKDLSR